jgi:midasin (ATPase involved in ribosome maturation)
MIDDSSSMGAAGPLALSALCTISGALSHLDLANDSLCIASFAEDTKILHSFGSPLTDEKELQVLSSFTFAARRTMLASSLQTGICFLTYIRLDTQNFSHVHSHAHI